MPAQLITPHIMSTKDDSKLHSPFTSLLSSNAPVSQTEQSNVRSFVSGLTDKLASLDGQITEMQDLLLQLHLERETVKRLVIKHQALCCSIRRVPVELWQDIFDHCREDDSKRWTRMKSSLGVDVFPWNVSQVCREWRAIALLTSELWSSVRICFDDFRDESSLIFHRRLLLQLIRSNTRRLNVSVMAGMESSPSRYCQRSIYDSLMTHSSRIANMSLYDEDNAHSLDTRFYVPTSSSSSPIQFRTLSRLELRIPADEMVDSFHADAAPELRHVSITFTNKFRFNGPLLIQFPWAQLTTCELTNIPVFAAPHILSQLQNLHTLSLSTADLAPIQLPTDIETLGFPTLHTLSIDLHPRTVNWFLTRFNFPELRILKASVSTAIHPTLAECIQRSSPSVQELYITDIRSEFHLQRLTGLLESLPALRTLELTLVENVDVSIMGSVLGADSSQSHSRSYGDELELGLGIGGIPICPRLERLTFVGNMRYGSKVDGGCFVELVEQICSESGRRLGSLSSSEEEEPTSKPSSPRLCNINIEGFNGWTVDWISRLRYLKKRAGLSLSVFGLTDDPDPWVLPRELI